MSYSHPYSVQNVKVTDKAVKKKIHKPKKGKKKVQRRVMQGNYNEFF